ncbi:MAG TPA: TonB family protein [bacterium]|nr:TonB family protein [bacterium]
MNRLQKKCLIATAGLHLSLVLILVFGAAFFTEHSKPDETELLTVIPANLIDAAFSSGVKGAQPPPPTPPQPPQPVQQPQPQPPQPKPEPVKQPDPEPVKPTPTLMQKVETFFKPTEKLPPEDLKPVETADKPVKPKHEIKVDLTKQVVRNTSKPAPDTTAADNAREAKRLRDARLKAIAKAARSIKENASSATTVEMPGEGSVSYANYASVVRSVYERAWTPPDDADNDDAITKVSVTIARDGTVISSRLLNPSGDSRVDASVRRTLDRVTFVAPFPDGAKEKERTFIINFNLKAKRMLG